MFQGWAWNEAYLARAFLQYNDTFRIELFTSLLAREARGYLAQHMPLCLRSEGQSLWLRRVRNGRDDDATIGASLPGAAAVDSSHPSAR